jgi:hypothetical protein
MCGANTRRAVRGWGEGEGGALAQQVSESGAVKKSGPGPPEPLTEAALTVPCCGVQPATVEPFCATRCENGFTMSCVQPPNQMSHSDVSYDDVSHMIMSVNDSVPWQLSRACYRA